MEAVLAVTPYSDETLLYYCKNQKALLIDLLSLVQRDEYTWKEYED